MIVQEKKVQFVVRKKLPKSIRIHQKSLLALFYSINHTRMKT